jgi:large subunit ribosomal protein L10
MPFSRQQKEDLMNRYQQGMAGAPHIFLMDYKGVTVTDDTIFRRRVREVGGTYEVVKNRLVLRAIEGTALQDLKDKFRGPTAVAFSGDDPVGLAKAITSFVKDVPEVEIKGGLVEGQIISPEDVQQIASLPSREELISKLVFLLQSPVSGFVKVLGAIPRQFVIALEQIRQQKEGSTSDG